MNNQATEEQWELYQLGKTQLQELGSDLDCPITSTATALGSIDNLINILCRLRHKLEV